MSISSRDSNGADVPNCVWVCGRVTAEAQNPFTDRLLQDDFGRTSYEYHDINTTMSNPALPFTLS